MNVREKLALDRYDVSSPIPVKPSMICPNELCHAKFEVDQKFCVNCGENLSQYLVTEMSNYKRDLICYHAEEASKFKAFKSDIYDEFDLLYNPKRDSVFMFAFTKCHLDGFKAVYEFLNDMKQFNLF